MSLLLTLNIFWCLYSIVTFKRILHFVLLFLLQTLGMYLFPVSDLFYNSIDFRLVFSSFIHLQKGFPRSRIFPRSGMHRGRLNLPPFHIELRELVIWKVSARLARTGRFDRSLFFVFSKLACMESFHSNQVGSRLHTVDDFAANDPLLEKTDI